MSRLQPKTLRNYAVAIALVLAALLLMLALDPVIELKNTFLTFYLALTLAALYGGQNAGLFATLLSAIVANYFFIEPRYSVFLTFAGGIRLLVFIFQGGVVSILVGSLRTAQHQAQRSLHKREQVEADLRELDERLRAMADAAPILIWETDENGVIFLNRYYLDFFGVSFESVREMGWAEFLHPDDASGYETTWREAMKQRQPYTYDCRFRRADGQYRWLRNKSQPVGKNRLAGCSLDITDYKQAEAALLESREHLRILTATIPQLIWSATPDGNIDYLSEQWADYVGMPPEQLYDWNWQQVVHPEDLPKTTQDWEHSLQTGAPIEIQHRFRYHTGEWRWQLVRGIAIKDERGQVTKWVGTCTDIQNEVDIKIALEASYKTEQQARSNAEAAREEAERANRIKDEFLAVLSHELRSPLNPILGWTKLLQSQKFSQAETAQALETIERNAKLQAQLIEDLLDVSRILRGKMVLNLSPVNLVNTIEAAIETVRLAAETKGVHIHVNLQRDSGYISGDTARLQQIIWNLLTNAVKFTPQGGKVEVRLRHGEGYAQIQVQDTGKGIKPDFLPYIFDSFRQEDGAITRKFGGLGLGLAIARHLTEQHGGTITVESSGEGQGATFTVSLPLQSAAVDLPSEKGVPDQVLNLGSLKILVVDDEADMRALMQVMLTSYSAQVQVVASAMEALHLLDTWQPDVLISDIGMPEVDGYMLLRQVRRLLPERGGQIPAIALTAYAGEYDQKQALAAGFQQHIPKPVEPEQLVKAIANLIKPQQCGEIGA
jgi:PAS domain S-box-containing protein